MTSTNPNPLKLWQWHRHSFGSLQEVRAKMNTTLLLTPYWQLKLRKAEHGNTTANNGSASYAPYTLHYKPNRVRTTSISKSPTHTPTLDNHKTKQLTPLRHSPEQAISLTHTHGKPGRNDHDKTTKEEIATLIREHKVKALTWMSICKRTDIMNQYVRDQLNILRAPQVRTPSTSTRTLTVTTHTTRRRTTHATHIHHPPH